MTSEPALLSPPTGNFLRLLLLLLVLWQVANQRQRCIPPPTMMECEENELNTPISYYITHYS